MKYRTLLCLFCMLLVTSCSAKTKQNLTVSISTNTQIVPTLTLTTPTQVASLGNIDNQEESRIFQDVFYENEKVSQIGAGDMSFVAWSPDGEIIAIATKTGIRILDAHTLEERSFIKTGRGVIQLAFSPNTKSIATNHGGDSINIWDVDTGELKATLGNDFFIYSGGFPLDYTISFEFDPTGQWILATETDSVQIWDIKSQTLIREFQYEKKEAFPDATFSKDRTTIAASWGDKIILWEVSTGKVIKTIDFRSHAKIEFNENGTKLIVLGQNDDLTIVDIASGTRERLGSVNPANDYSAEIVSLSTDNKKLVTYRANHETAVVQIWDLDTGHVLSRISDENYIDGVALSPDSTQLVTTTREDEVKIWETKKGIVIKEVQSGKINGKTIAISPDNENIAVANVDGIRVYSLKSGKLLFTLSQDQSRIWNIAFNPTGTLLASISVDGAVRVWNTQSGSIVKQLVDPKEEKAYWPIADTGVLFNSDGSRLMVWSWTQNGYPLQIWDTNKWEVIKSIQSDTPGALSHDGTQMAIIDGDNKAYVVSVSNSWMKMTLEDSERTSYILFSPDNKYLFGVDWLDAEVNVWDAKTGKKVIRINRNDDRGDLPLDAYIRLAVNKDGSRLATIQYHTEVNVWDTQTWKLIKNFKAPSGIRDVAISNDGNIVAAFSGDVIYIWYLD